MEKSKCCNAELDYAHVGDAFAGNVLLSATVTYCTKCLSVIDSEIKLSK